MAIIGIDLGTSNSAAAVLRGGRPVIIPRAEGISIGGKAFPSYVTFIADGQMLIGEPASPALRGFRKTRRSASKPHYVRPRKRCLRKTPALLRNAPRH